MGQERTDSGRTGTMGSFVYVIASILMVVLWSAYLCFDGRRSPPQKDMHVIRMLAQRTLLRPVP
ncbi:hypothetical protein OESDEN_03873 [Oesophagostomum dentatum]|uniref:Uncharacterized protein n=1 Tax=Oesophagostomum dentatum TaxID=61180 RepID=A0A0B1TK53_OESDE|nr:hypothetical protein OESDEN_03873 [Oesophagostomum dentatum]